MGHVHTVSAGAECAGPGFETRTAFDALIRELEIVELEGSTQLTPQVEKRIAILGELAGKELFPSISTEHDYEFAATQTRANMDMTCDPLELSQLEFALSLLGLGYPEFSGN